MKFISLALLIVLPFIAQAQIYSGTTKIKATLETMVSTFQKGDIVILGELHDHVGHHNSHKEILNEMHSQGISFDVGMEFFYDYRKQNIVDSYLIEDISEEDFLKKINWGATPFDWYRPKVLASLETGGWTWAINAPRELTKFVAKNGVEQLSPELSQLMPPNFKMGSQDYKERFSNAIGGGHVPPNKLNNYFASQCIWDETMAWQALKGFHKHDSDVLVIVVGEFHATYNQGLARSLLARGAKRVVTISHVDSTGMSEQEKSQAIEPHSNWGARGDWIVLSER